MRKKDLYESIIEIFEREMPVAEPELHYSSPFQLLIAVILSAQCTDKRVNLVTPALFAAYPTPETLGEATQEDVYELIKSVSYPHNKTRHLIGMAQMLVKEFDSQVPDTTEQLTRLPGVGRKTANVIQAVIFKKATMAVDTHVFRVSHRIGLVSSKCTTPYSVEKELTRYFPSDIIPKAHHWLILHGRYTCLARTPKCDKCYLQEVCQNFKRAHKKSAKKEESQEK
jgi:endonuclease-3